MIRNFQLPDQMLNQAVLNALTANIAVLDKEGTIIAINNAWERFARENGDAALAHTGVGVNYLDICRGASGPCAEEAWQVLHGIEAVLAGSLAEFTLEYPCHSPTEKRWFLLYATPLLHVGGGAVVSHLNITERKLAEEERLRLFEREQAAHAAAQEAVRIRDAFLSIASHELKTPLTALLGNAQLLQRRLGHADGLQDRDRRALQVIVEQAGRLDKMISALLDVSRLETGQFAIERAPMDLGALVRRVVDEVRPTLSRHELQLVIAGEAFMIAGDELRLEQVLQNLIGNAIKYSPQGGPVVVRVEQGGERVHIAVIDQGIGIPAGALPQLFRRFFRAENADAEHITGTGIGLYVVKEIVTLHGGEVAVESVEGQGSTFHVYLPLLK